MIYVVKSQSYLRTPLVSILMEGEDWMVGFDDMFNHLKEQPRPIKQRILNRGEISLAAALGLSEFSAHYFYFRRGLVIKIHKSRIVGVGFNENTIS